jgi:surface protein
MKKLTYLFLAILIVACTTDDNNNVDNSNTLEKEWLYTHTALEATATSSTTIVMPFTEDIFAFTDRPNREHKYISGDEFASYWNDYDDENSFKLDPPNAVLTWVDADGVSEVEVVITDANFDGANMIYTIENTTITTNQSFEDVSLFVDGNGNDNAVYVGPNNIVMASAGAVNNEQGNIGNVTYTVVNLTTLKFLIEQGDDVTKVVPSLVTDMSDMFKNSGFNQDISSWDVSNVTDMSGMFNDTPFNQDISSWDVSKVTNMRGMFYNAGFFNQNISTWDVGNVTNMFRMFDNSGFNQDISSWDVSNVTNMRGMFNNAIFFYQDISTWDVSNVTDMEQMFREANDFNQDISSWDVSNVTNMFRMFDNSGFNQDISSWSVDNVTSCGLFSINSPLTEANTPNFTNCTP